MRPEQPTESIHAMAPLYALGTLEPDELLRFEKHLRDGCPACEDEVGAQERVVAAISLLAPPVQPPAGLRSRILDAVGPPPQDQGRSSNSTQVWKRWTAPESSSEWFLLRGRDGDWEGTDIEGVLVKRLFADPVHDKLTMLVRMAPGTSYPSHRHGGPEECYVIEGDLKIGDLTMQKGDYQRVERQSVHPVQSTEGGCLLLIVSSFHDEILH